MAVLRVAAHLPRLLVLGAVFLFAGATLTYGAASRISATDGAKPVAPVSAPTVVVPDVSGQAFVFAKGALQDAGFAWQVTGRVRGYAVNRVVSQSPAPGTKLRDTGAPTVTVTLERTSYAETGEPADVSPYYGTAVVLATPAVHHIAAPATAIPPVTKGAEKKIPAAAKKTPVVTSTKPSVATKRPPAFVIAGAPKEPLKEMPLTDRARLLDKWLSNHPRPTNAAVRRFLFQNAWIVTGAKFGWWHGAGALRVLIGADAKAQAIWGVGHKSELAARKALAEVEARSH
jgi:PASTA domain